MSGEAYGGAPNPGVKNPLASSYQWGNISQQELDMLRSKLVESIIQVVVTDITGALLPGPAGQQLASWSIALLEDVGGTVDAITALIAGIGGTVINDVVIVLNTVQQILDAIANALGLAGTGHTPAEVEAALSSIPGSVISGATAIEQSTLDAIANALGHSGTGHTPSDILSYLGAIPGTVISGVTTIEQAILDAVANALGHSGTGHTSGDIQTYLGIIPGGNLTGGLNTALTISGNALSSLFNSSGTLASQLTGAINTGVTISGNAVSALFNSSGVLASSLNGALNPAVTFLVGASNISLSTLLQNLNATGQFAASQLTGGINTAVTFGGTALSTLLSNINSTGQFAASALTGALNTGVTVSGTAIGSLLQNLNSSGQILGSAITGAVSAALISGTTTAQQTLQDALNQALNPLAAANATATTLATQVQASLQGLIPAAINNIDGTFTALTGVTNNSDGTFTYAPAVNAVQTLINQADGTFNTVAGALQQAATSAVSQAGSNLTAAVSNIQSFMNGLFGGFTGQTATAVSPAQATAAASSLTLTVGNHASNLSVLNTNAPVSYGYGLTASGSLNASSAFSGSLPATFTDVSGTPLGVHSAKYNVACGTEAETVTGTWASPPAAGTYYYLFLRMNTGTTTYLYLKIGNTSIEVGCLVAGTKTVFQTITQYVVTNPFGTDPAATFTTQVAFYANATYSLSVDAAYVLTFNYLLYPSGVYHDANGDVALSNGTINKSATYTDAGHVSQQGALYRYGGYGTDETSLPGSITQFTLTDAGPAAGPARAFVATDELTTSLSFVDLTTTTDTVTVTIGPSGMAQVSIYAWMRNGTSGDGALMSFALSGTNTQAADDSYGILHISASASQIAGIGATFLLTGLTAGTTTFKAKYRATSGGTAGFQNRRIAVIPL